MNIPDWFKDEYLTKESMEKSGKKASENFRNNVIEYLNNVKKLFTEYDWTQVALVRDKYDLVLRDVTDKTAAKFCLIGACNRVSYDTDNILMRSSVIDFLLNYIEKEYSENEFPSASAIAWFNDYHANSVDDVINMIDNAIQYINDGKSMYK